MNLQKLAGVSPFARLRRNNAAVTAKAEDEKDDDEDKKSKTSKAEDEKDDDEDKKSKTSKAEDDKDDDEDKKSKSKADDDDDEPEARVARIRAAERKRVRAICDAGLEAGNPDFAYELAVNSDMAAANAIVILRGAGAQSKPSRDTLRDRMAGTKQPDIGAGDPSSASASDPKSFAGRIVAAHRKALGEAA